MARFGDDEWMDERLKGLLNDERARRAWLEEQLEAEREKTRIWRGRAEDRAERIADLEASRRPWWRIAKTRNKKYLSDSNPVQPATYEPVAVQSKPLFPSVAVVASTDLVPIFSRLFRTLEILDSTRREQLSADFLALSSSSFESLPTDITDHLSLEARQPIVIVGEIDSISPTIKSHLRGDDVVVAPHEVASVGISGMGVMASWRPGVEKSETAPGVESILDSNGKPVWLVAYPGADEDALISGASSGLPVLEAHPDRRTSLEVNPEEFRRAAVLTRRWFFKEQSVWAKAEHMARLLPVDVPYTWPRVAALLISNRAELIQGAVDAIASQDYPSVEVFVGLHGGGDAAPLRDVFARHQLDASVEALPADRPLGWCLNHALESTSSEIFAKIDDDDFYGPSYLTDGVCALLYSGAEVTGKGARYTYLHESDKTYLIGESVEERFVDLVPGASMISRRRVWEDVRFAHRYSRVDSTFLAGVRSVGGAVWSSTRDEFVVGRRARGHTWQAEESLFKARGDVAWDGLKLGRAFVGREEDAVSPRGLLYV